MAYRNDTLCGIFHNQALRYGENHAFLMGKFDEHGKPMDQYRSMTWAQARRMAIDLARGLVSMGLKKNDRCILFAESRPEWIIADQAIQACGAAGVPLYPTLSRDDLIFMIQDSEASIIITSTCSKADDLVRLRRSHDVLKEIPIISMETWDRPRPENVFGFTDIMLRGRESVAVEEVEERIRSVTPDNIAAIIYTSGTTGRSKGVILTQNNFVVNIHQSTQAELMKRQKERDLHLTALVHLPLCHVYARSADYHVAGLYLGGILAFAENFNTIPRNLMEIRPHIITSIPRFFEKTYDMVMAGARKQKPINQRLFAWALSIGEKYVNGMATGKRISQADLLQFGIANRLVFDRLKKVMGMDRLVMALSGGGKLPKDVCTFFRALNIQLSEGYGLTETSPVINFNDLEIIDADHQGPMYRWFYDKVLDTTIDLMVELPAKGISPYGNPINAARLGLCYSSLLYKLRVKPGTVGKPVIWTEEKIADDGEILVKGPQVFSGYWKMEDATKDAFTEDGFFKTGDIGHFDDEGFLVITDRKKDLFVTSGGKNIAPHPIELDLQSQRYIEQACLVGDGRKFISALIVPDFTELTKYAKKNGITFASNAELVARDEIAALIRAGVDTVNEKLARYEQVKYFEILDAPFSEETGELTPTLKVKRKVVNDKFRDRIEKMYRN